MCACSNSNRGRSGATLAETSDFQHRALRLEMVCGGDGADFVADIFVIDMHRFAAFVTNEEDTVMRAARMGIREIGVRAFNPHGEITAHKYIEDAVNAVGCYPLPTRRRKVVGNVVGRDRTIVPGEFDKHSLTH